MKNLISYIVLAFPLTAFANPLEQNVQGLYEGTWNNGPAEVRVVAMGNDTFRLMARQTKAINPARAEVKAKVVDGKLAFAKANWNAGAIKGKLGNDGTINVRKVERKSPTLGKQAPAGATVVAGPKGPSGMDRKNNLPWYLSTMADHGNPVDEATLRKNNHPAPGSKKKPGRELYIGVDSDGSFQVPKGGMQSKEFFPGSFNAHVEFMCNLVSKARSQGRGNSGVFLPTGKEIQILDSFGTGTYLGGGCGGLYKFKDPDTMEPVLNPAGKDDQKYNLSSLPPQTWQTYDIEFREKKNADGKAQGFLTVYHNGVKIHDNVEMKPGKGPFRFQDHGNPVRYRNIWVKPIP